MTNRIVVDPAICFGKPHIKGTRLKVSFILELLGSGWTVEEILQEYDHVRRKDVLACLSYAGKLLDNIKQDIGATNPA